MAVQHGELGLNGQLPVPGSHSGLDRRHLSEAEGLQRSQRTKTSTCSLICQVRTEVHRCTIRPVEVLVSRRRRRILQAVRAILALSLIACIGGIVSFLFLGGACSGQYKPPVIWRMESDNSYYII